MFKRKASITNRILRIFLIATLILLPTATLAESYNPFSWFSKKINPKGKYTLVFLDESKPDMLVKLKKREEGYNLLVTNLETMETIIIKCGEGMGSSLRLTLVVN